MRWLWARCAVLHCYERFRASEDETLGTNNKAAVDKPDEFCNKNKVKVEYAGGKRRARRDQVSQGSAVVTQHARQPTIGLHVLSVSDDVTIARVELL